MFELFRKHKFDLDHPEVVENNFCSYHKYICSRCGAAYFLEPWEMKNLPRKMSHGCPGKSSPQKLIVWEVPFHESGRPGSYQA